MAPDETDATGRANGHDPSAKSDDIAAWTEIDAYCGRTPPDHDEAWTITSITRRFAQGERAIDVVESPTGESVTLGEPHWYVTAAHDPFPETTSGETECEHYVFSDVTDLAAWFSEMTGTE